MTGHDTLTATVAGGWAVGSFVFTRKNRVTGDRQALLAELRIEYEDGSVEVIGTDSSWQVTEDSPVRMAESMTAKPTMPRRKPPAGTTPRPKR